MSEPDDADLELGSHARAASHANSDGRQRSVWMLGSFAVLVVAILLLIPLVVGWMSISVDDEDREIALGDGAPLVTVPAGWVLEQRPFARELIMHTPNGAVALCFSAADPGSKPVTDNAAASETEALAGHLALEHGWSSVPLMVERSPSGALVVHAAAPQAAAPESTTNVTRLTSAASSDPACADLPIAMLTGVDPRPDASGQLVAVRVGSEGDIAPYLGEIADVLAEVRAA